MFKPAQVLSRVTILAILLPGCAGIPGFGGSQPLDTYELTAPVPDKGRRRAGLQVLIAEPTALKAFDGENIVIKTTPGSIQYLKGAQWADRLPKIVQARLAESFQLSGRFGGVGRPGEGLAIDYQVIVEIRSFEVQVAGGYQQSYVELSVRLMNDRNGVVMATRTFEASSAVAGTGNEAYVAAIDRAFGQAATEIVDWTAQRI